MTALTQHERDRFATWLEALIARDEARGEEYEESGGLCSIASATAAIEGSAGRYVLANLRSMETQEKAR